MVASAGQSIELTITRLASCVGLQMDFANGREIVAKATNTGLVVTSKNLVLHPLSVTSKHLNEAFFTAEAGGHLIGLDLSARPLVDWWAAGQKSRKSETATGTLQIRACLRGWQAGKWLDGDLSVRGKSGEILHWVGPGAMSTTRLSMTKEPGGGLENLALPRDRAALRSLIFAAQNQYQVEPGKKVVVLVEAWDHRAGLAMVLLRAAFPEQAIWCIANGSEPHTAKLLLRNLQINFLRPKPEVRQPTPNLDWLPLAKAFAGIKPNELLSAANQFFPLVPESFLNAKF